MTIIEQGRQIVQMANDLNILGRGIFVTPFIILDRCAIAPNVKENEFLFITSAESMKPSCTPKTGMACTIDTFYYCNSIGKCESFKLDQVASVDYEGKNTFQTYSVGDVVRVHLANGKIHNLEFCLNGCNSKKVANLIISAAKNVTDVENITQSFTLSVEDLPENLQIIYMEVLSNYLCLQGDIQDPAQHAALESIVVRLGLSADTRKKVRDYLFLIQENERIKTGSLLFRCQKNMSYGSYELFRYSLMQDILYLKRVISSDNDWTKDRFINSLQKFLVISDEQMAVMQSAISLYENMQAKDADLNLTNRDTKRILKSANALHIPEVSLFCSGSPYNVDTYHGLRRQQKLNRSITKQRELLLQAVLQNQQLVMNHLAEDMNDITVRLLKSVQKGNQRDEMIHQLSVKLSNFEKQMANIAHKNEIVTMTQLQNQIRSSIPENDYANLRSQDQVLIKECYVHSDNAYEIRKDLSIRELRMLNRIEEIKTNE